MPSDPLMTPEAREFLDSLPFQCGWYNDRMEPWYYISREKLEAPIAQLISDLALARQRVHQLEQERDAAELTNKVQAVVAHMRCMTCGTAVFQPNARCQMHISAHDAWQTEQTLHAAWEKRAYEAEAQAEIARQRVEAAEQALVNANRTLQNPDKWQEWCDIRVLERAEAAETALARLRGEP